jgi:hypothetical protein
VDVKRCFSLFLAMYEVLFHLKFTGFCCCNSTAEGSFFFFFFLYGVSIMESSGESFVNFVWNEKSYSSNIYIYIYIYIYFKYRNRDALPESALFLKRGRLTKKASPF